MVNRIPFDDDDQAEEPTEEPTPGRVPKGLLRCCAQALGRLNEDLRNVALIATGLPLPLREAIHDAACAIEAAEDEAASFLADGGE